MLSSTNQVALAISSDRPRKRARYVARACGECKRRKIRCDGRKPCNHCKKRHAGVCAYESGLHACTCPFSHRDDGADCHNASNHMPGSDSPMNFVNTAAPVSCESGWPTSDLPNTMQSQMTELMERMNSLEKTVLTEPRTEPHDTPPMITDTANPLRDNKDASEDRILSKKPLPVFHGSTSPFFYIQVVKLSLNKQELEVSDFESDRSSKDDLASVNVGDAPQLAQNDEIEGEALADKLAPGALGMDGTIPSLVVLLHTIPIGEGLRLVRVYHDLLGFRFPILDLNILIQQTRNLYTEMRVSAHITPRAAAEVPLVRLKEVDHQIVKMVLAIALVSERTSKSEIARRAYESVRSYMCAKVWDGPLVLEDLILLLLTALYHLSCGNWRLAWRTGSHSARAVCELGLNHKNVLLRTFPDEEKHAEAVKIFWCAVILDREWGFGSGLPMHLQDGDIDADLPEPDDEPYLKAMIQYSRLATRGWDSFMKWLKRPARDAYDAQQLLGAFLDQMDQWQTKLPDDFRYRSADYNSSDRIRWARASLYLRANQLRILMLRPFLYTYSGSAGNPENFNLAARVACDNFRVLADLQATSSLLHTQRTICSHFLLTIVSALLLITVYRKAPSNAAANPSSELVAQTSKFQDILQSLFQAIDLVNSLIVASDSSGELSSMVATIEGLVGRLRLHPFDELQQLDGRVFSGGNFPQTEMHGPSSLPSVTRPDFPLIHLSEPSSANFDGYNLETSAEANRTGCSATNEVQMVENAMSDSGQCHGFTMSAGVVTQTTQRVEDGNPFSAIVPWESDPYFWEPQALEEISMMFFPGHTS